MKRRNFLMAVAGAVAAVPLAKRVAEAESPHGSVTAIESGEAHLEGIVLPAQSNITQWDTGEGVNTLVSLPSHTHAINLIPYHGVTLERAWRIINDPEYINYHGEFPEYDANHPIERIELPTGEYGYTVQERGTQRGAAITDHSLMYADANLASQELASRALYSEVVSLLQLEPQASAPFIHGHSFLKTE